MISVPSGSGRDAVPKTGKFANLQWLHQHISHRKSASNWSKHESDEEEASQLQEDDNMNSSSSSIQSHGNIDDTEQDSTDLTHSPASSESRPTSNQSSTNANEVAVVVNPKKSTASASKTPKRSWAATNRRKGSTKEDVDLAMIQIAEKLLQEPSEKTPSVDDDEEMLFARSFAKRLKKLPQRAKAFVRIQQEQIFQAEFAPAQQYPAPVKPMHMGYNQPQYGHHPGSSDYTPNLQSL